MSTASTAYVTCAADGKNYAWHFTGVTAIEHSLTLDLNREESREGDAVNSARNLPDRVTLSVIETDTAHSTGWSARMLEAMASLKRNRIPCRVVTSLGTYENMLLTEITATQDEENQCGWSGSLTFTQYVPSDGENAVKTNDNSSTRENTGFTGNLVQLTAETVNRLLETRL